MINDESILGDHAQPELITTLEVEEIVEPIGQSNLSVQVEFLIMGRKWGAL